MRVQKLRDSLVSLWESFATSDMVLGYIVAASVGLFALMAVLVSVSTRPSDPSWEELLIFGGVGSVVLLLAYIARLTYDVREFRNDRRKRAAGVSTRSRTNARSRSISKAPGHTLLSIVSFLFGYKTVEQTFKPLVADWRFEYFEAMRESRKWKARWVSLRYRWSFVMAMSLSKLVSLLKQIRSVTK